VNTFYNPFIPLIRPLSALFKAVEMSFGLTDGMGLNIYKHLVYWKRIAINVDERADMQSAIPIVAAPEVQCEP